VAVISVAAMQSLIRSSAIHIRSGYAGYQRGGMSGKTRDGFKTLLRSSMD
jgi:hypothetical protein